MGSPFVHVTIGAPVVLLEGFGVNMTGVDRGAGGCAVDRLLGRPRRRTGRLAGG